MSNEHIILSIRNKPRIQCLKSAQDPHSPTSCDYSNQEYCPLCGAKLSRNWRELRSN